MILLKIESAYLIPQKKKDGFSTIRHAIGDATFVGKRIGKSCPGNLKGAAYATAEVLFIANEMVTSD